jgi:lysophospholipase L1-like esterase
MQVTNGLRSATQHFMLTVFNKKTVSILPLGNSITNGTDRYNSYRRPLWQALHEGNYNFDLIGSWDKHHMGGPVPDPDFDMDHDGHSGRNTADVLHPPDWDDHRGSLSLWLKNYSPDIVLIELGTNDIFQCKSQDELFRNFTNIIASLRQRNGRVKIFIGTIIPLGPRWSKEKYCGALSLGEALQAVNAKLPGFCASQSTRESKVIWVDLFPAIDPATQMYDDIHPNTEGEQALARVWLEAIRREIPRF